MSGHRGHRGSRFSYYRNVAPSKSSWTRCFYWRPVTTRFSSRSQSPHKCETIPIVITQKGRNNEPKWKAFLPFRIEPASVWAFDGWQNRGHCRFNSIWQQTVTECDEVCRLRHCFVLSFLVRLPRRHMDWSKACHNVFFINKVSNYRKCVCATPAIGTKIRKRDEEREKRKAKERRRWRWQWRQPSAQLAINTNAQTFTRAAISFPIDTIIAFECVKYYYYCRADDFGSGETQGAKCVVRVDMLWRTELPSSVKLYKQTELSRSEKCEIEKKNSFPNNALGDLGDV